MLAGSVTTSVSPFLTVTVRLTAGVDDGGVVMRTRAGVELAVVNSNSTALSLGGFAMNCMMYSLPTLVRPAEVKTRLVQFSGTRSS